MWARVRQLNLVLINEAVESSTPLDVVMFGDSITERWNGRDFGRAHNDAYKNNSLAFQRLFQKQNGAKVQGLALGIAADRVSLKLACVCYELQSS